MVPLVVGVSVLNQYKVVPLAFLEFVEAVVILDLVLRKTRYGRMVYAVGGNAEAARRAGISTVLIRISVFGIASTLAALGGIMLVSRNIAASTTTGGGQELMMAIAAAVIGGTSLFGGRGNAYSALLGGLVLGAITSGLLLLPNVDTSVRFMITAAVLLVAVIMDAASRRGRKTHARGGASMFFVKPITRPDRRLVCVIGRRCRPATSRTARWCVGGPGAAVPGYGSYRGL